MSVYALKKTLLLISLLFVNFLASAQNVAEPADTHPEWSKPYQPFQIAGNLYYVGTYDLACYLIVTPKGNILINTGLASSLSMIKANIEALGFKFADIKILLTTQAHYDHMGAMAAIKKLTGAKMMVDEGDAEVVADGGRSDYALGGKTSTYAPVKVDRLLHNGNTIELGGMQLVMLHHPGHTKGSCSFLFDVKDKKRTYRVLIANMPTIVTDKGFSDIPAYPGIERDYAYTLNAMKKLSFDIWLASHASQFGLHSKHKPGDGYNPAAFIDRKGYDAELNDLQDQFFKKVKGK
ncbi:MAG: bla [Mucilaginibacter sp.]|nr:bla [Mucilaginibacter sp.]